MSPIFWTTSRHCSAMSRQRCSARRLPQETILKTQLSIFTRPFSPNTIRSDRVDRGVYYTPPQVISYIVRSVDSLLKTELNRPDGLADDNTLILDPATGTGGFLLTVLDHVREYVAETYGAGEWTQYINAELVRRIFGFELLVAPYTIAHLKLSLFLQDARLACG